MMRTTRAIATAMVLFAASPVLAQSPRQLTADDYRQAEKFVGYNTNPLVLNAGVRPNWLPDGRFWYRTLRAAGPEFVLVDPAARTKRPAFDHDRLATALSAAAGRTYERAKLPFLSIDLSTDGRSVTFSAGARRYTCAVDGTSCKGEERPAARTDVLSPDGKRAVFIRDWNLWVRDVATSQETPLTTDGVKDYGYATDNAGWRYSDRPVVKWSPDSRKVATFQQDQRGVGEMYLVDTSVGHPKLQAWKYPLPGDRVITMIERVVIDVDRKRTVRFKMGPDQHRSTLCDDVICGDDWVDVQWSQDGASLAFVSASRDHKLAELKVADAQTGVVRDVMNELVGTFFESGNGRANWRYLPASNEVRLVLAAKRLGTPVSLRPHHRQPEAADHQRLVERDAGAARGRDRRASSTSRRSGRRPVATRTSATSIAWGWMGRASSCCRRPTPITTSTWIRAAASSWTPGPRPTRRRPRCCATPAAGRCCRSNRPTSRGSSPRVGNHRCASR